MTNVVLIPGAFHGGWYWEPILPALKGAGHRVLAPTLPGLEAGYSPSVPVNLESHVRFLTELVHDLNSDDVVLVGHSYGGMIITGAAARAPERVSSLIYLDAPVPKVGERVWDLIPMEAWAKSVAACTDGYVVQPPPELVAIDHRAVPHPMATFLQPLEAPTELLSMPRTFVVAARSSAFQYVHDELSRDPGWACTSMPCGHDFVREAHGTLADLILERVVSG